MIRIEKEADQTRRHLVEERLRGTNSRHSAVMRALRGTPADARIPVEAYALDRDALQGDVLAGGLVGHAWAHWLHVDLLWVDGRHRGSGLGSQLMREAERRARDEHDCRHSRVETWDFQAPDFYRKLGYALVATVEDYPPGHQGHLLVKQL